MFDQELLSDKVLVDLPPGYIMRPLCISDYSRGFLEVLRVTGKVGYVSQKRWEERCHWLRNRAQTSDEYVIVVLDVERDRIVGTGRWVCERGL
jgi:glucosamine-phosphate N-acetyltransferase